MLTGHDGAYFMPIAILISVIIGAKSSKVQDTLVKIQELLIRIQPGGKQ